MTTWSKVGHLCLHGLRQCFFFGINQELYNFAAEIDTHHSRQLEKDLCEFSSISVECFLSDIAEKFKLGFIVVRGMFVPFWILHFLTRVPKYVIK